MVEKYETRDCVNAAIRSVEYETGQTIQTAEFYITRGG